MINNCTFPFISFHFHFIHFISLKKYNDNLSQPPDGRANQGGCAFKSDLIISKNKTKKERETKKQNREK